MEGYKDSAIPSLPDFNTPARTSISTAIEMGSSSKLGESAESLQNERARRGRMSQNYSILQSVVPNLLPKASRGTILTETIDFIHRLEEERRRLEGLKNWASTPSQFPAKPILSTCTNRRTSVDVTSAAGGVAFFGIQLASRRHLVVNIFRVFENYGAQILAANVTVDEEQQLTLTVTAVVSGGNSTVEMIKREILII